jgi:hypothetical protein
MNGNRMQMVCIDCVNANENKNVNAGSNFRIPAEFGRCECCEKRYIIVPFRRFFSENTVIQPSQLGNPVQSEDKHIETSKIIESLKVSLENSTKESREHSVIIQELQNVVGKLQAKIQQPTIIELPKTQNNKAPKNVKSTEDADAAYE